MTDHPQGLSGWARIDNDIGEIHARIGTLEAKVIELEERLGEGGSPAEPMSTGKRHAP